MERNDLCAKEISGVISGEERSASIEEANILSVLNAFRQSEFHFAFAG